MKNKTKFFIFGQGRSGSNLLVDLLNSHPDIYCDRELLNNFRVARKNKVFRVLIKLFPYQYIKYYLNKNPGKIYGFKLMIYQLMGYKKIQKKLFDQKWKIIHIKRDDVLQQTFSAIIAEKSGKYLRTNNDDEDKNIFNIEPRRVFDGILYRTRDLEREKNILKDLKFLEINYEKDLANSNKWKETTERVFKFLGTYPVDISSSTLKTNSVANEKRISNYEEIMEYLKETQFSHLVK